MKLIKIVGILTIILVLATSIANATFTISETQLYSKGKCKPLLKVASNGGEITVTKVFYKNNGKEYPAYCVNKELGGVGEYGSYSVTINEAVSNPQVWRAITNGYPYKSLESLGVLDEDEAYAATKQAVYCVLYGYDLSRYLPIGDAGERTLNAIKKIVNIARNTGDTKPSNQIKIIENEDWKIDEKNKTYITKTLEIKTECSVQKYIISLEDTKENQIKITDMNDNEIQETKENKFKIKMPINLLEKDGIIGIKVQANLETKPVLYGNSNNSTYQNYALAGEIYEGGEGDIKVNYNKNTNRLKIIKKDDNDGKALEGVEFNIIDENGEIKYSKVKTNEKGEIIIDGILPGKYFIEEVSTKQGYIKLNNKVEFDIDLNEEVEVTITNEKEKEPKKEKKESQKEKTYTEKNYKLPVTGM